MKRNVTYIYRRPTVTAGQVGLSAPLFFYVALRRSTGGYPNVIQAQHTYLLMFFTLSSRKQMESSPVEM